MHWLSQSAEALIKKCTEQHGSSGTVDVAVVGSGYGGAVAALRFAEHGQTVYVLERGQEYVAGEFPNDLSQVGKHVRSELAAQTGVASQGYEEALFDFRIGLNAGALVGNGLGGGSLINAGVGLQPDERVFRQDDWPAALQQENLDKWFERARAMHELQIPGKPAHGCTQPTDMTATAKYQRMRDLRANVQLGRNCPAGDKNIGVAFEPTPIAVQLDSPVRGDLGPRKPCIGCGDCVTGCNYHAKLSLTSTYLPRAVKAGAEIFTGLTVLHVSQDPAGNTEFPWVLHFMRTSERKLQHEIESRAHPASGPAGDSSGKSWIYTLRARHVILGAGTFGSTEILLRSRAKGLKLSNTALGMGVSGNGDDVAYAYDMHDPANAMGWGSKAAPKSVVGPTITSVIRFTDPYDVKRSTLIQDGAVPGLMQGVVHELLTTLGTLAQLDKWGIRSRDGGDPLALQPAALVNTLTLLGMGHDSAGGVIVYDLKADRMKWGWPKAADQKMPALHKERMKGCVEELGGIYIANPAVSALPESMNTVLSGPKPGGTVFTVHPLGGCRMGDMALNGVVNHWGAVWKADGELHDGLYVMDGSTIPSSLGANPMLTITALAERACDMILKGVTKKSSTPRQLDTYPQGPVPLEVTDDVHGGTRLAEVLRGELKLPPDTSLATLPQSLQALMDGHTTLAAALFLEFSVPHWQTLFDDRQHRVQVIPAQASAKQPRYTDSRLELDANRIGGVDKLTPLLVTDGTVDFFYPRKDSWLKRADRWLRTLLTYAVGRWVPDYIKRAPTQDAGVLKRLASAWNQCVGGAKLIGHANEVRSFRYEIKLIDADNTKYLLRGDKVIEAAASWKSLRSWWWGVMFKGGWPAPERRSLWQQMTEIQVALYQDADQYAGTNTKPLISGRLAMDLPDMLRRVMPHLDTPRDSLNALQEFAGYPMLILRAMLKMRLLDFRLPDYKENLPKADPALTTKPEPYFELDAVTYPDLADLTDQTGNRHATPEKPVAHMLKVPLTWAENETVQPEMIRIGLVRYKAKKLSSKRVEGVDRVKSIVLLNGFLLSTQAFVATELNAVGGNLAGQLYAAGWDVWLLEYRASPLLDVSARNFNMDDIAAFDIPHAVDYIIKTVSHELALDKEKAQIFAYSRCVGSAALAMSVLSGFLRRANGVNKLAGLQLSDFHPFLVGSPSAQMRLQFAAFLSNTFKLDYLQFTAGTVSADLLHSTLDRVFSSAHYAYKDDHSPHYLHETEGQRCPHERDLRDPQHDSTTCKRITGLMSRSYHHDQLLDETHEKLDLYFGRGNLGVFLQGAKCVAYERLVTTDGQNAYVNDENIKEYFNMPLLLVHGAHNALFDIESFNRSRSQFKRMLRSRAEGGHNRYLRFKHFGHVDLILGKDAPQKVFPLLVQFFDAALNAPPEQAPLASNRCRARLPRTGPIVGWVRPGSATTTLVRIWIELDDTHSDKPIAALTVLRYAGKHTGHTEPMTQAWDITTEIFQTPGVKTATYPDPENLVHPVQSNVWYAVADVEVANEFLEGATLEMVGIHSYRTPAPNTAAKAPEDAAHLPAEWGLPMTLEEVDSMGERSPAFTGDEMPAPHILVGAIPGNVPYSYLRPLNRDIAQLALADPDPFTLRESAKEGNNAQSGHAPTRIYPMAELNPATDPDIFITPLQQDLQLANATTHRANPDTLSRQRRTLRKYGERIVTLGSTQFSDKSVDDLTFFAAACRHPGLTGFEYARADESLLRARTAADTRHPSFMLMLGDQIYADARAGVIDTQSPIEKLLPRYRDAFGSSRGFRQLAQTLPLYMVIDDHEINDAWSQEQALASTSNAVLASNAKSAFKVFQYAHGPGKPGDLQNPTAPVEGFNYSTTHGGFPFIVLDTRTQRTRVPERRILHPSQWRWLEAWLLDEQKKGAHPKFVVSGSVVVPGLKEHGGLPAPRGADTWQMSCLERARLLSFIADNNIANVVFVSSDYHCSAAAEISFTHKPAVKAWAIVAPPLHAPLRFANSEAFEVMAVERIELPGGEAVVASTAWDGEGWLECKVERQRPGDKDAFALSLRFWLRSLEQADWPDTPTEWNQVL